jgi:hypothetical protein
LLIPFRTLHAASKLQPPLTFKDKLCSLLNDDVTHGFNLPLPLSMTHQIPGLLLSPMNIARQSSIDAAGNIIPKD